MPNKFQINKNLKKLLIALILLLSLSNIGLVYGQDDGYDPYPSEKYFPYDEFPIEYIDDDQNINKDRLIFTPKSVEVLWEYMKGMLILPRENLIIQGRNPSTDEYVLENYYTGPAFSYTNEGLYTANKNVEDFEGNSFEEIRYDSDLLYDPVRDWMCSLQDCSSSEDGCIDPSWRFNTPTFCRRKLPLCAERKSYDSNYMATGEVDLSLYFNPVDRKGEITDVFGSYRTLTYAHDGVDVGGDQLKVYATMDGIVEYAGSSNNAYGNYIVIKHDYDGIYSLYAHLSDGSTTVVKGQQVKRGQVIGLTGNTGHSSGPHLHFELRRIADNWTHPWNKTSWNGGHECLLSVAKKNYGQIKKDNCESSIDPGPIFYGMPVSYDVLIELKGTPYDTQQSSDSVIGSSGGDDNAVSSIPFTLNYIFQPVSDKPKVAGMGECVDDPFCATAGYVYFTEGYVSKVEASLKYPKANKNLNIHTNLFKGVFVGNLPNSSKEHMNVAGAIDSFMNDKDLKNYLSKCGNCKIGLAHGFRSVSEQQTIYQDLCGGVPCPYAAQPGYSQHHSGLAVDIYLLQDGTWGTMTNFDNTLKKIIEKYGFIQPVLLDKPHFFYSKGRTLPGMTGDSSGTTDGGSSDSPQSTSTDVTYDGSLLDSNPNWTSPLPLCDKNLCEENPAATPSNLIDMFAVIGSITEVPPELLYAITMQETGGLCGEVGYAGEIQECTGNPLEIAWAVPTDQVNGSTQEIRGITQVSASEIRRVTTVHKDLLYKCVEAATGLPVDQHRSESTNPSLFKDPHSTADPKISRHLVAHSVCITAIVARYHAAEWDQWRTNPNGTVDAKKVYDGSYPTLTLEDWYGFIQKQESAQVDINWPTSTPYKEAYTLIEHIGRRYHGACIFRKEDSGYNRDIYYCKDIENFFNEARGNYSVSTSGQNNINRFGGTINCEEYSVDGMPTIKLDKSLVKVMVIGDSHVDFESTKLMLNLKDEYAKASVNVEFVGTRSTNEIKDEGYTGATVRSILAGNDGAVANKVNLSQNQNLVFIQLGSNEVLNTGTSIKDFIENMTELVHKINSENGETAIVIGSIPPFKGNSDKSADIAEYNVALKALTAELGVNVRFAETSLSFADDTKDIQADKIHLTPIGSYKTVLNWIQAAKPFFEVDESVGLSKLNIQVIGDETVSDSFLLDYLSNRLKDAGIEFEFFGSNPYVLENSIYHDGYSGITLNELEERLEVSGSADIFVIQFDANFLNSFSATEFYKNLKGVVDKIMLENPEAIILIGSLPEFNTDKSNQDLIINLLNPQIEKLDSQTDESIIYINSELETNITVNPNNSINAVGASQIASQMYTYLSTLVSK